MSTVPYGNLMQMANMVRNRQPGSLGGDVDPRANPVGPIQAGGPQSFSSGLGTGMPQPWGGQPPSTGPIGYSGGFGAGGMGANPIGQNPVGPPQTFGSQPMMPPAQPVGPQFGGYGSFGGQQQMPPAQPVGPEYGGWGSFGSQQKMPPGRPIGPQQLGGGSYGSQPMMPGSQPIGQEPWGGGNFDNLLA